MALATVSSIAQATGLDAAYLAGSDARALQAEREARQVLGDTRYDEIVASGSGADYDALVEAESLLALYHALPLMNLMLTERGGIIRATGAEESREELIGKRELDSYRAELKRQALTILQRLATRADESDTSPITPWIDSV